MLFRFRHLAVFLIGIKSKAGERLTWDQDVGSCFTGEAAGLREKKNINEHPQGKIGAVKVFFCFVFI